jgi:Xaa-Pro aminopeptidase
MGLKKLGFEERYLPVAEHARISGYLKDRCRLIPAHDIVEDRRQVKDNAEIGKIREAVRITGLAYEHIKNFVVPGAKESEVSAEFERFIRRNGCNSSAFETIVASGANSSQPHHFTGQGVLKENEPVLIDFGVDYQGYKSDLTRVLFLGKIKVLARRVYDIVRKAQELAIKRIPLGQKWLKLIRLRGVYRLQRICSLFYP